MSSRFPIADRLLQRLQQRRDQHRYRQRSLVEGAQGPQLRVDGRLLHNFCSNDYLGLAGCPALAQALASSAGSLGSGASHLVCGHSEAHHELEATLATLTGRPRALLFSTGFMANMGVIQALVGRGDTVVQDKLNHASLLDGALLSRANLKRYRHNDVAHAEQLLQGASGARLLVTDGVFSMDGDLAPMMELAQLAQAQQAWLMVDDAHGFGCLGPQGRGSVAALNLGQEDVPVYMATLGKAVGSFGAFVAGSETLIESLIQFARPYIYTTAMPPALAAATREALECVVQADAERASLQRLISLFRTECERESLPLMPSHTAIQPVPVGADADALALSDFLRERGFWVTAIRPPTVAEGTARLRITLTAAHDEATVRALVTALAEGMHAQGLAGGGVR